MASARDLLLKRFQWVDGHADVWPVFWHGDAFRAIVESLVAPFRSALITAELAGCAVVVDQMHPGSGRALGQFHAVVTSEELTRCSRMSR